MVNTIELVMYTQVCDMFHIRSAQRLKIKERLKDSRNTQTGTSV